MKGFCKTVLCAFLSVSYVAGAESPTADRTVERFIAECRVEAPATGDLKTGQWYHGLPRVRAYAEKTGVPLVAVWSNSRCGDCEKLVRNFLSPAFRKKMAESGYLYCFTWARDPDGDKYNREVCIWCTKNAANTLYPLVRLYWKKKDGSTGADQAVRGNRVDRGLEYGEGTYAYIADVFKDYVPSAPPAYACGSFVNGGTACDRLEIREDTAWLDIPLKRTGGQVARATNETLRLRFPGVKDAVSFPIAWAAGESNRTLRVSDLRPAGFTFAAGQSLAMTLDSDGATSAVVSVALVKDPENDPKNPLWIGTRTAATLAAGEWTMDLEVAKARARRKGTPILALIGGSLWCPDCVKADRYLIDTPAFRNWLVRNDVTCVALDVPNVTRGRTTSLMTYDPYATSDRYVTSTEPKQERVQSGAGYLSRNGIEPEKAAEIVARNCRLATTSVGEGGLCRPENMDEGNAETGPFKTGIPCLVLMRADGTVVGRIFQFNNVSPADTSAVAAYLARMDELLALAAEKDEESNADWRTATGEHAFATNGIVSTVSAVDLADVWLLRPFENAVKGTITLKALTAKPTQGTADFETMAAEDNVCLSLIKVKDGAAATAAAKTGNVFSGLTLEVACVPEKGVKWYVEVRAIGTVDASDGSRRISKTFALERKDDSTVRYVLGLDLRCGTVSAQEALNDRRVETDRLFSDQIVVDPERRSLLGLMTVALSSAGAARAVFRGAAGTIALSAGGWSVRNGKAWPRKVMLTAAHTAHRLELSVHADGRVGYRFSEPARNAMAVGEFGNTVWSETCPAKDFQGRFTVDCPPVRYEGEEGGVPKGDVWMTLDLPPEAVNTGMMNYCGCLPNGTPFGGVAKLIEYTRADGARSALLPVMFSSSNDVFTAVLQIAAGAGALYRDAVHDHRSVTAYAGVVPRWTHAADAPQASFDVSYGLYGAYYDPDENIRACVEREDHYRNTPLYFRAAGAVGHLPITVTPAAIGIAGGVRNPSDVTLSFDRRTGRLGGTFRFVPPGKANAVTATCSGVLLPGWGGCSECAHPWKVLRPLCVGSYHYPDTVVCEVESHGKVVSKAREIVRGGSFSVDEKKQDGEIRR